MIVGVGIDIVEVNRIAEKIEKRSGLKEKLFSSAEIEFCERSANPSESFAARFAAKEAFLKATGKGLLLGYELRDVEIVNDEAGKPLLVLHNEFEKVFRESGWTRLHVSLSHIDKTACAVIIIEA